MDMRREGYVEGEKRGRAEGKKRGRAEGEKVMQNKIAAKFNGDAENYRG